MSKSYHMGITLYPSPRLDESKFTPKVLVDLCVGVYTNPSNRVKELTLPLFLSRLKYSENTLSYSATNVPQTSRESDTSLESFISP